MSHVFPFGNVDCHYQVNWIELICIEICLNNPETAGIICVNYRTLPTKFNIYTGTTAVTLSIIYLEPLLQYIWIVPT